MHVYLPKLKWTRYLTYLHMHAHTPVHIDTEVWPTAAVTYLNWPDPPCLYHWSLLIWKLLINSLPLELLSQCWMMQRIARSVTKFNIWKTMLTKHKNSTLTQVMSAMKEADMRLVVWNDVHEKRNVVENTELLLKLQV